MDLRNLIQGFHEGWYSLHERVHSLVYSFGDLRHVHQSFCRRGQRIDHCLLSRRKCQGALSVRFPPGQHRTRHTFWIGEIMANSPIWFKNFSAPWVRGRSRWAAAQASLKLLEYSGTALSDVAVIACGTSSLWFARASAVGLPLELPFLEEDFLNSFSSGILSGGKRRRFVSARSKRVPQDILGRHQW